MEINTFFSERANTHKERDSVEKTKSVWPFKINVSRECRFNLWWKEKTYSKNKLSCIFKSLHSWNGAESKFRRKIFFFDQCEAGEVQIRENGLAKVYFWCLSFQFITSKPSLVEKDSENREKNMLKLVAWNWLWFKLGTKFNFAGFFFFQNWVQTGLGNEAIWDDFLTCLECYRTHLKFL